MAIKKAFQDLVALLEENKNKKVSSILPEIITLCSAKSGGSGGESTIRKDDDGNVTHVKCYYHGVWEPVNVDGSGDETHCEYGKKATSSTGLSNMCKIGTAAWTKQNRDAKNANIKMLADVAAGEVAPTDIIEMQATIETARKVVVAREDGLGANDEAV